VGGLFVCLHNQKNVRQGFERTLLLVTAETGFSLRTLGLHF